MKSAKMLAILVVALCLMVCVAKVSEAAPMGTAFTYQGRLMDANLPADEIYDFRFKLFDELSDGNQVGIDANAPDVDVIDGYFTVALDFNDVGVFSGDARWLDIGVRPGDSTDPNAFVTLSPRTELTPTPYALQTRGIFVDEAGNVGIGTTEPGTKLHVESGGAKAVFGKNTASGGIGVEGQARNFSGGGVGVYGKSYSTDGIGVFGIAAMSTGKNYGVYGQSQSSSGEGVYGYNSGSGNYGYLGSTNYGVYGYSSSMWGMAGSSDSGVGVRGESSSGIGLYGESSSGIGVRGVSTTFWAGFFEGPDNDGTIATLGIRSGGQNMLLGGNEIDAISGDKKLYLNYNSQGDVILNANGGNVGIGTTEPTRDLHIYRDVGPAQVGIVTADTSSKAQVIFGDGGGNKWTISSDNTDDNKLHFRSGHASGTPRVTFQQNGNVGIGTTNPTRKLVVRGNILVQSEGTGTNVLELGEGLDYAEGFDVTEDADIEAGTVLVIDSDNPGKLTVSRSAYDSKVAGIVAGANGMGSGVRLGVGQFDYDVALAGRVYCKVDATEAAVQPGDLLTTSTTPGHAMKATDYGRANGTILGKAMEKLEKGQKGQILVLVTLQ